MATFSNKERAGLPPRDLYYPVYVKDEQDDTGTPRSWYAEYDELLHDAEEKFYQQYASKDFEPSENDCWLRIDGFADRASIDIKAEHLYCNVDGKTVRSKRSRTVRAAQLFSLWVGQTYVEALPIIDRSIPCSKDARCANPMHVSFKHVPQGQRLISHDQPKLLPRANRASHARGFSIVHNNIVRRLIVDQMQLGSTEDLHKQEAEIVGWVNYPKREYGRTVGNTSLIILRVNGVWYKLMKDWLSEKDRARVANIPQLFMPE